ncbi:MAG: helix-turn-helix transcriptional regulator [Chloroflexi bacterium]|nr:helix-turn-helix transcriptional regulator [Chloroflexota bacterium]
MSLRMRYLFATVRKSDDTAYTVDEVARGTGVSLTYLRNMLAGRQDNPSRKVIAAIARFFCVSPAYFFESDSEINSESEAPASEIEVALRSADRLGPEGRQILLDMIRLAQRIVGQRSLDT